jgi:hypothetical protein
MTSLVRQRQVMERERIIGTLLMGFAGVYLLFFVALLVDGDGLRPTDVFSALLFAGLGITGLRQVLKARRDLAAFEAEHGAGAGVQQPIR